MKWLMVVLLALSADAESVSQADLENWLTLWQTRMQLQDWKISIGFASHREIGGMGDSHYNPGTKLATIRILDVAEATRYAPFKQVRRLSELTVVHELTHVLTADLGQEIPSKHDGIEDIAEALFLEDLPVCISPEKFMGAELDAMQWEGFNQAGRDEVVRKLAAAFLETAAISDGDRMWPKRNEEACTKGILTFFAESIWR